MLRTILVLMLMLLSACDAPVKTRVIVCGGPSNFNCPVWMYCELGEFCGGIDKEGICKPRPEYCEDNEAFVCGCDGTTYRNACWAAAKGKSIKTSGSCEAIPADQ